MLYYVGTFHPVPGKYEMPPDYQLSAEQLRGMRLDNLPVTIEHKGIRQAVAELLGSGTELTPSSVGAALDAQGGDRAAVGIVVHSAEGADGRFYALFAVDVENFPVVPMLVRAGALRGLSLTHRVGDPPLPLELSLCVRPARPECHVMRASSSLRDQLDYMRRAIIRPTMDAKTPLQNVIDSLSEEDRKLVTARFADLMSAIDKANQEAKEAQEASAKAVEEAKQTAAKQSEVNTSLLESQIRMMSEQLNPEIRKAYYCEADPLIQELTSDNGATVLRAADRMICACNKQMMEMRASTLTTREGPPKRKAEAEHPDDPAAEQDPITRALAETFSV